MSEVVTIRVYSKEGEPLRLTPPAPPEKTLGDRLWSLAEKLERFIALKVMRRLGLWELVVWTVEYPDGTRDVYLSRAKADKYAEGHIVLPEPLTWWLQGNHKIGTFDL